MAAVSSEMASFLAVLLFSLLWNGTKQNLDFCPGDVEPLIDGPRFRLQDQFFSSDLSNDTAHESRLSGDSWCTEPSSSLTQPWLQITFETSITIHSLQTAGEDGGLFSSDRYVTSFEVYIGNRGSDLVPITANDSSTPMVFNRTETPDVQDTALPSPVTTEVLRIVILSWTPMDDDICFDLEALGCLSQPVCQNISLLSADPSVLVFINASSAMSDDPAVDALDSGNNAWCTAEDFMDGPAPYLLVSFNGSVTLNHMEARGGVGGFSYVTAFQLEVQEEEEESGRFEAYGVMDEPTVFRTETSELVVYTFWRPVRGVTFRFNIVDGERHFSNDDFCWNIRIHGCLSSDIAVTTPELETTTDSLPVTTASGLTTREPTRGSSNPPDSEPTGTDRNFNTVIISGTVIGGALFLILLLSVVIIFCFLCCYCRTSSPPPEEMTSNDTVEESLPTYRKFDNTIYGEDLPSPAEKVELDQIPPPVPNNTYESLPSSLPLRSPPELQYDYADTTVVKARVKARVPANGNKVLDQESEALVTTGFGVPDEMQSNPSYRVGAAGDTQGADKSAQEKDAAIIESMADNPLYGANNN